MRTDLVAFFSVAECFQRNGLDHLERRLDVQIDARTRLRIRVPCPIPGLTHHLPCATRFAIQSGPVSLALFTFFTSPEQMKCEFPQHENVCKRCKAGGHPCIVEGRKPRNTPK